MLIYEIHHRKTKNFIECVVYTIEISKIYIFIYFFQPPSSISVVSSQLYQYHSPNNGMDNCTTLVLVKELNQCILQNKCTNWIL